jgi:hypothetical protein
MVVGVVEGGIVGAPEGAVGVATGASSMSSGGHSPASASGLFSGAVCTHARVSEGAKLKDTLHIFVHIRGFQLYYTKIPPKFLSDHGFAV